MGGYRHVSNMSFVSMVVERAVASQLNDYLVANNLLPRFQFAYRKGVFDRDGCAPGMLRLFEGSRQATRFIVEPVGHVCCF